MHHVHLTVGIPCFNEERNLPALLDDLHQQKLPEGLFIEFLIVDDASTDRTSVIAQEAAERDARVRLLRHAARGGSTAAWNTVFREARGDLLIRIDGDVRLSEDFLAVLIADHARDSRPTVRYAVLLPARPRTLIQTGSAFINAYLARQNVMGHFTSATLFGAEVSLPRVLYENLQLPENVAANDFYLARLCALRGWPVAVSRGARFFVKTSATWADFRLQAARCRGAHEQVLALLGPWRQPRFAAIPAIVLTALRRPVGCVLFLLLRLFCHRARSVPNAAWESAKSTK